MISPGIIVAVDTTWSMRTICIARETGGWSTCGTARAESRHAPSSSGGWARDREAGGAGEAALAPR